MSFRISSSPAHEWIRPTVAFLLFLPAPPLEALLLNGHDSGGMQFRGELAGITGDSVHIRLAGSDDSLQIGIPLDRMEALSIEIPEHPDASFLRELESATGLLRRIDPATILGLIDHLEEREPGENGSETYLWAERLAKVAPEGAIRRRARLLKARSLYALGLYRLLEQELEYLNETLPPVKASLQLCSLNAHLLVNREEYAEALFWARLPLLQIPATDDSLMIELTSLAAELIERLEQP